MSFHEPKLLAVCKKQYAYKLKTNLGIFFSLMIVQLLALLLSLNGSASMGAGSSSMVINLKLISGDIIIVFTLIWAFIIGNTVAGNACRLDFSFVSTRLTSNLASVCLLATAALVGGITATLSGVLLRLLVYWFQDVYTNNSLYLAPLTLLSGSYVTALYAFLLSVLGYFFGMLTQRNKALTIVIPVLFLGSLFIEARRAGEVQLLTTIFVFFVRETSMLLFSMKVVCAAALLFATVILFTNRMEVRR
ncbi:MAG TPA: hypothetical protein VFC74_04270 [Oscillospiraceae bacterium]|nr:hypothetical protein [Oscillospiraceae bacterium]